MATLLKIDSRVPVLVRELGTRRDGIVWVVHPNRFDRVVEMVNAHGGPDLWEIREATEAEVNEVHA